MSNWIFPTVKHVWNIPCILFFHACQKHNSLPLGPIQPSSPPAQELNGSTHNCSNCENVLWQPCRLPTVYFMRTLGNAYILLLVCGRGRKPKTLEFGRVVVVLVQLRFVTLRSWLSRDLSWLTCWYLRIGVSPIQSVSSVCSGGCDSWHDSWCNSWRGTIVCQGSRWVESRVAGVRAVVAPVWRICWCSSQAELGTRIWKLLKSFST